MGMQTIMVRRIGYAVLLPFILGCLLLGIEMGLSDLTGGQQLAILIAALLMSLPSLIVLARGTDLLDRSSRP